MSVAERRHLIDDLPGAFQESDFLTRFLAAFEQVYAPIAAELDAIPSLFGLPPTARLASRAARGARTLVLDSAAGFCSGDVVQIEDVRHPLRTSPAHVEFAQVAAVDASPQPPELNESLPAALPTILRLTAPLRLDHVLWAPVRPVGEVARTSALAEEAPPATTATQDVNVAAAAAVVSAGDVLRIDEGPAVEYAQVVAVEGERVTVTPALARGHAIAQPVAVLGEPPAFVAPAAFGAADRTGAEYVLTADALADTDALELDTITGLSRGDVLHIRESDAARVEFVSLAALPLERPPGPDVARFALDLHARLRFDHAAGVAVGRVGSAVAGSARLAHAAGTNARHVTLDDPRLLAAASGDVVAIGTGASLDYAQVVSIDGTRIEIAPRLRHDQPVGAGVTRRVGSGGTRFLAWLAGWLGAGLRTDRGEIWNAELVRAAGAVAPWRGTRRGVEAWLRTSLRGDATATVRDLSNPMQLGLVSRLGVDTALCGVPHMFAADVYTNPRASGTHTPRGIVALADAARAAIDEDKPAWTDYDVRIYAQTMQLGTDSEEDVGARLGDTTLLWTDPLVVQGDEERRQG